MAAPMLDIMKTLWVVVASDETEESLILIYRENANCNIKGQCLVSHQIASMGWCTHRKYSVMSLR